jgi:hypothetical protein
VEAEHRNGGLGCRDSWRREMERGTVPGRAEQGGAGPVRARRRGTETPWRQPCARRRQRNERRRTRGKRTRARTRRSRKKDGDGGSGGCRIARRRRQGRGAGTGGKATRGSVELGDGRRSRGFLAASDEDSAGQRGWRRGRARWSSELGGCRRWTREALEQKGARASGRHAWLRSS